MKKLKSKKMRIRSLCYIDLIFDKVENTKEVGFKINKYNMDIILMKKR